MRITKQITKLLLDQVSEAIEVHNEKLYNTVALDLQSAIEGAEKKVKEAEQLLAQLIEDRQNALAAAGYVDWQKKRAILNVAERDLILEEQGLTKDDLRTWVEPFWKRYSTVKPV